MTETPIGEGVVVEATSYNCFSRLQVRRVKDGKMFDIHRATTAIPPIDARGTILDVQTTMGRYVTFQTSKEE